MSKENHKTVGIIGGMGPEATVELMRRVIELTPANDDCDHIRMLVDNNPKVPSRIKALIDGTGESPLPELLKMAQGLEQAGADFLVMPCNTAHHYYSDIVDAVSIPFINMIDLTAEYIKSEFSNVKKIGLLATSATVKIKLYDNAFSNNGIDVIYPKTTQQVFVMAAIKAVKSNSLDNEVIKNYNSIANTLSADCLVLACTELSVIADKLTTSLPVIDAMQVLAKKIVDQAG